MKHGLFPKFLNLLKQVFAEPLPPPNIKENTSSTCRLCPSRCPPLRRSFDSDSGRQSAWKRETSDRRHFAPALTSPSAGGRRILLFHAQTESPLRRIPANFRPQNSQKMGQNPLFS